MLRRLLKRLTTGKRHKHLSRIVLGPDELGLARDASMTQRWSCRVHLGRASVWVLEVKAFDELKRHVPHSHQISARASTHATFTGIRMSARWGLAFGPLLLLSACAGDTSRPPVALAQPAGLLGGVSRLDPAAHDNELDDRLARRKTMAGRMLAAIALERVTARKPDPSRFTGK